MEKVYIVGAKRTPIGKFGGGLSSFSVAELGSKVIAAVVEQSKVPVEAISQLLMGNVLQAGQGQNPARKAGRLAKLPDSIPAITINDVCGSGLSSVNIGASLIQSGQADIIIAGGMESMSNASYLLEKARTGYKMGNGSLVDSMLKDSLIDSVDKYHMGITAENIVEKYQVSRKVMDKFTVNSHFKASEATKLGKFKSEIVPLEVIKKSGTAIVKLDENIRGDSTIEKLSKLSAVFKKDGGVTAGNSSSINDGASALMLASENAIKKYQLEPIAEWVSSSIVGLAPEYMGMGPLYAVQKTLEDSNLEKNDIDIFEINEAFASQSIACLNELGLDYDKVNPKGGALALGHPVGASGSRILTTLIYELSECKGNYGIASLCVGGGMGVATLIKAISRDNTKQKVLTDF